MYELLRRLEGSHASSKGLTARESGAGRGRAGGEGEGRGKLLLGWEGALELQKTLQVSTETRVGSKEDEGELESGRAETLSLPLFPSTLHSPDLTCLSFS